ncbi:MAG TPA: hypothetical protein VFB63_18635 [Bryobacteraceae bacterium]|nr:hypothetical protein [Bryobacteraceae bacterium]
MSTRLLRQIRTAIEQLNPHDVRVTAERPVSVVLHAYDSASYAEMEDFFIPAAVSHKKRLEVSEYLFREGDAGVPSQADLHVIDRQLALQVGGDGLDLPPGTFVYDSQQPKHMAANILAAKQDLGLPLSRAFPPFRAIVSQRTIHQISKENAVFALATALPDIAPGILSLPWAIPEAMSDTAVLTVNQIRMAFLLAAASDRPVGYREQKMEVASIIAGAFGWRAIARNLVGKIPFGGGLLPKAAIAYAATYVEGRSLERLYSRGYGLTRKERSLEYGNAMTKGRQVVGTLFDAWQQRRARALH